MVEGAAGWICAGLSLRCLKIVLYESPNQEVNKLFTNLKEKWLKKTENLKSKSVSIIYTFINNINQLCNVIGLRYILHDLSF